MVSDYKSCGWSGIQYFTKQILIFMILRVVHEMGFDSKITGKLRRPRATQAIHQIDPSEVHLTWKIIKFGAEAEEVV